MQSQKEEKKRTERKEKEKRWNLILSLSPIPLHILSCCSLKLIDSSHTWSLRVQANQKSFPSLQLSYNSRGLFIQIWLYLTQLWLQREGPTTSTTELDSAIRLWFSNGNVAVNSQFLCHQPRVHFRLFASRHRRLSPSPLHVTDSFSSFYFSS